MWERRRREHGRGRDQGQGADRQDPDGWGSRPGPHKGGDRRGSGHQLHPRRHPVPEAHGLRVAQGLHQGQAVDP